MDMESKKIEEEIKLIEKRKGDREKLFRKEHNQAIMEKLRTSLIERGLIPENTPSNDAVNHPSHYNQYKGFEVIDVCEQLRRPDGSGNYNRGNAFKYLARAGWKNPNREIEDLRKALFYIKREINRLRTQEESEYVIVPGQE